MPSPTNRESWRIPPPGMRGDPRDVHLWRATLNCGPEELAGYAQLLSPEEIERARRFAFARDHRRFIVRRAVLRDILSRYVPLAPQHLTFLSTPQGKPSLDLEPGNAELTFSSTHSGDTALIAVGWQRPVGVDFETWSDPKSPGTCVDYSAIARQFFSAREQSLVNSAPPTEQAMAFRRIWTCKEAVLKAAGCGLSIDLERVILPCDMQSGPAVILNSEHDHFGSHWTVLTFSLDQAGIGAVAVNPAPHAFHFWEHPKKPLLPPIPCSSPVRALRCDAASNRTKTSALGQDAVRTLTFNKTMEPLRGSGE